MSITGIENTGSSSAATTSGTKLAENFDTFLTMLTVQLKNQDPLSPMDSTEFTNQLVQFSAVEQQIASNKNLENLISVTQTNTKAQAIAYIGHTIETAGTVLPLQGGVETQTNTIALTNSSASFKYTLDGTSSTTTISIKDSNGDVVRTLSGNTSSGSHEITWDGKDASNEKLPDGNYTVAVTATDSAGAGVASKVYTTSRTQGASFSYTLPSEAKALTVVIKDVSGKVLANLPVKTTAGRHEMTWDGKDTNGNTMPDGAYKIEIAGTDKDGKAMSVGTTVYGRVTDVAADATETLIAMGQVVAKVEDVLTVREKTTAAAN